MFTDYSLLQIKLPKQKHIQFLCWDLYRNIIFFPHPPLKLYSYLNYRLLISLHTLHLDPDHYDFLSVSLPSDCYLWYIYYDALKSYTGKWMPWLPLNLKLYSNCCLISWLVNSQRWINGKSLHYESGEKHWLNSFPATQSSKALAK